MFIIRKNQDLLHIIKQWNSIHGNDEKGKTWITWQQTQQNDQQTNK